jgi:hypothetical protein
VSISRRYFWKPTNWRWKANAYYLSSSFPTLLFLPVLSPSLGSHCPDHISYNIYSWKMLKYSYFRSPFNCLAMPDTISDAKCDVDRLCGLVDRDPSYRSISLGSIPGATRFSEK